MERLDVICIGAVNYDYMFHCTADDINIKEGQDGDEKLSNPISEVENDIFELIEKDREYTTQIGGSAFITLKVIKHILRDLNVSYVGSCGIPTEFDLKYGKSNNIEEELAHLDDREWLFTDHENSENPYDKAIAKSVVRLYNHSRNCIKIAPCANNMLLKKIQEKECKKRGAFARYLAEAKWIHLSSLSDFSQFEVIMDYVIEAKQINKNLKISMDPGFEYTSIRRDRLQRLMRVVDYVFLNNAEKGNIGLNAETEQELNQNLFDYFTNEEMNASRKLIVKHIDHHEISSFSDGKIETYIIPHTILPISELNNDTGAGDSFAGGFIAGMLADGLHADIEKAINLGVIAAKGRMISFDYENPYMKIQSLTDDYFANL